MKRGLLIGTVNAIGMALICFREVTTVANYTRKHVRRIAVVDNLGYGSPRKIEESNIAGTYNATKQQNEESAEEPSVVYEETKKERIPAKAKYEEHAPPEAKGQQPNRYPIAVSEEMTKERILKAKKENQAPLLKAKRQ